MEGLESQLGAILNNPQMMEKIMSIAQNFQSEPAAPTAGGDFGQEVDFATVQKIASLIGKTGVDARQQALLQALGPYLSSQRVQKLEKAMRAAKLAGMASSFLGSLGR